MEGRDRNRRDRSLLLLITALSALVITVVLYFAGAFARWTG